MHNITDAGYAVNSQEFSYLMDKLGLRLIEKNISLSFAESATAGRITSSFSLIKDSGKFLKGGIICYDACIKEDILMVDPALIREFTPESAEVTEAITYGVNKMIKAEISVGVTGLTRPGGSETFLKPVGTMFIHGIRKGVTIFKDRSVFSGTAEQIILKTTFLVAQLINKSI